MLNNNNRYTINLITSSTEPPCFRISHTIRVWNTGVITIHHIRVGDGNGAGSGNADDDDNSIVLSSSSSYWVRTTNRTKEEILQQCVVCVNNKRDPKGSRERNIHHAKALKDILQTFGAEEHFLHKNLEGESESTNFTNIQSEYVGNLSKIKLLEACIMAYEMRDTFIIPTLVDEYSGAVEDHW